MGLLCSAEFVVANGWPQSCIVHSSRTDTSIDYLFAADGQCYLLKSELREQLDPNLPVYITRAPVKCLGGYKYVQSSDSIYLGQIVFDSGKTFPVKFRTEAEGGASVWNFPIVNQLDSGVWSGSYSTPLQNSSTRAWVAPGKPAILGHIHSDNRSGYYLIRAVSSSLSGFGVKRTCPSLKLTLSFQTNSGIETENGSPWSETPDSIKAYTVLFGLCGAFPLQPKSGEPVIFSTFRRRVENEQPGVYTVMAESIEGEGEVLIEIYSLPFDMNL